MGAAVDARLKFPGDLEVDAHGDLYLVDGCGVLRVDPRGRVAVVAMPGA